MKKYNIGLYMMVLLLSICAFNLVHTDYTFAHNKTINDENTVVAEAQFYGIPTFGYEVDVIKESDSETENVRGRFWGITAHH